MLSVLHQPRCGECERGDHGIGADLGDALLPVGEPPDCPDIGAIGVQLLDRIAVEERSRVGAEQRERLMSGCGCCVHLVKPLQERASAGPLPPRGVSLALVSPFCGPGATGWREHDLNWAANS